LVSLITLIKDHRYSCFHNQLHPAVSTSTWVQENFLRVVSVEKVDLAAAEISKMKQHVVLCLGFEF